MRHTFLTATLLACACPLSAQVFELRAGSSTLSDSQGAAIEVRGGSYDASFGAGKIGPRFLGSARIVKHFEKTTLLLGTETIPFNLPTDIFDEDHYLTALGGGIRTALPGASLFLFGGMLSQNLDGPYFEGTRGEQPAAVVLFDSKLSPTVTLSSRTVLSKQITMIEGLAWRPRTFLQVAGSAGIGSGKEYAAASARIKYSWFDLKTAYIQANDRFRRANVSSVITAEPDRFNIVVNVAPGRHLTGSAGHTSYILPVDGVATAARSTVDQIAGSGQFGALGVSASVFRSTYENNRSNALILSANRNLSQKIHAQASYLYSSTGRGSRVGALVTTISEELTPRWSVSQIVNTSNGQSTVGFGASFISNLATFSADYETYYLPQHQPSPFEQLLIINADINVLGRVTMHGGTLVAPDGSIKHTIAAQSTLARGGVTSVADPRNAVGRFMVSGRVVDNNGLPVEGAALLIDHVQIYTDSDGNFVLHERQSRDHTFQVLEHQFLDGNTYRVLSANSHIRSSTTGETSRTIVRVQRV